MPDPLAVRTAGKTFLAAVDAIYGVYLDATWGFHLVLQQNMQMVAASSPSDRLAFSYTPPDDPSTEIQHVTTLGERSARNARGGTNEQYLSNLCIVGIYAYWDRNFRKKLTSALGLSDPLESPIMGDLRLLRNSIVHNNSIAQPDIARCTIITSFSPGDPIVLTEQQFDAVIREVRSYIDGLIRSVEHP